ncbi:competence type IV pilus major pilin ComGC [Thalassobacillus hwangdonensis]|uniref:ComG operon protein 3 n=1 Tax=Thalassobacillus hwangdonensis TaxID=546108 RepID=A0ABW3L025_9BACI
MTNEKGFTLIEMLIVLMIISVLLIITIPNLSDNSKTVKDKGCEALIKMAEAQAQSYYLDKNEMPATIATLQTEGYLESDTCPDGSKLTIDANGEVTANAPST